MKKAVKVNRKSQTVLVGTMAEVKQALATGKYTMGVFIKKGDGYIRYNADGSYRIGKQGDFGFCDQVLN